MLKQILAVALVVGVFSASFATAGDISIEYPDNGGGDDTQNDLAGTVTNDIILNADPGESILSQQVYLVLDSGSVVEHPFGSNLPPNDALIGSFANLAFDSFVSAGTEDTQAGAAPVPTLVARSDKLGGPGGSPALFDPTTWDALWGPELGQDTAGATDFLSLRLTLSGDANGTFSYLATFDQTDVRLVDIPVVNGVIGAIPEPASFGLAGLAMVGLVGRRRRR